MKVAPQFVPKLARKARLKHDRHSGQTMLLYPERGLILNGTAEDVAERCDGTRTVAAIASELAEAYGASADAITEDVIAFVTDLRDKGLLES